MNHQNESTMNKVREQISQIEKRLVKAEHDMQRVAKFDKVEKRNVSSQLIQQIGTTHSKSYRSFVMSM